MGDQTQMRKITTHIENDRQPRLYAGDNVAPGNAPQQYQIWVEDQDGKTAHGIDLDFISLEENGVTNEVLLAIVIDRLEGFQAGPFACDENARALNFCEFALDELHRRTRDRSARGVENKHEK